MDTPVGLSELNIVAHKLNQLLLTANDSDRSCTTTNADFVVEICDIDMSNATGSHNIDAVAKALGGGGESIPQWTRLLSSVSFDTGTEYCFEDDGDTVQVKS